LMIRYWGDKSHHWCMFVVLAPCLRTVSHAVSEEHNRTHQRGFTGHHDNIGPARLMHSLIHEQLLLHGKRLSSAVHFQDLILIHLCILPV